MKNFIKGLVFFIVIFIVMPTYGVELIERFVNLIPSEVSYCPGPGLSAAELSIINLLAFPILISGNFFETML